ncbi:MAG: hypothetical protein ACOYOS_13255 [Syntrophales bacterium]
MEYLADTVAIIRYFSGAGVKKAENEQSGINESCKTAPTRNSDIAIRNYYFHINGAINGIMSPDYAQVELDN